MGTAKRKSESEEKQRIKKKNDEETNECKLSGKF
jgi:hypothetical protein